MTTPRSRATHRITDARTMPAVTCAAAGAVVVGWILGESLLVEGFSWLQGLYLLTGSIVVVVSIRLHQTSTPTVAASARDDLEALR